MIDSEDNFELLEQDLENLERWNRVNGMEFIIKKYSEETIASSRATLSRRKLLPL